MKQVLIFWGGWTNHQITLVEAMAKLGYRVVLVKPARLSGGRLKQLPQSVADDVEIVSCNSAKDIETIAMMGSKEESLHINAALKSGNDINNLALRYLCENGYDVFSLPQESFQLMGMKRFLNGLKWWWYLSHTFRKNIKAYGLTGTNAEKCFLNMNVNQSKLFQFIYVTRKSTDVATFTKNEHLHFIYVGAIDTRKNIIPFVQYMMNYKRQDFTFDIFGSWSLDAELSQLVQTIPNITYHGKKGYDEVRACMTGADYLVLPSLYDGWGAVANEGLQSGCRLLLSKQSGCSIFTECHQELGYTFDAHNLSSLDNPMAKIFSKGALTAKEHQHIVKWADEKISPQIVAEYLDKIIKHYFQKDIRPKYPWI